MSVTPRRERPVNWLFRPFPDSVHGSGSKSGSSRALSSPRGGLELFDTTASERRRVQERSLFRLSRPDTDSLARTDAGDCGSNSRGDSARGSSSSRASSEIVDDVVAERKPVRDVPSRSSESYPSARFSSDASGSRPLSTSGRAQASEDTGVEQKKQRSGSSAVSRKSSTSGRAVAEKCTSTSEGNSCESNSRPRLMRYSYEFLKKLQKSKLSRKPPDCLARLRQEKILREHWKEDRKDAFVGGSLDQRETPGVQLDLGMTRRSFVAGCQVASLPQSSESNSKTSAKLLGLQPQSSTKEAGNGVIKESIGNRRIGSGRLERAFKDTRTDRDRDYGYNSGECASAGGGRNGRRSQFESFKNESSNPPRDLRRRDENAYRREDEPEWFTEGPTSRAETIELGGFEDHRRRSSAIVRRDKSDDVDGSSDRNSQSVCDENDDGADTVGECSPPGTPQDVGKGGEWSESSDKPTTPLPVYSRSDTPPSTDIVLGEHGGLELAHTSDSTKPVEHPSVPEDQNASFLNFESFFADSAQPESIVSQESVMPTGSRFMSKVFAKGPSASRDPPADPLPQQTNNPLLQFFQQSQGAHQPHLQPNGSDHLNSTLPLNSGSSVPLPPMDTGDQSAFLRNMIQSQHHQSDELRDRNHDDPQLARVPLLPCSQMGIVDNFHHDQAPHVGPPPMINSAPGYNPLETFLSSCHLPPVLSHGPGSIPLGQQHVPHHPPAHIHQQNGNIYPPVPAFMNGPQPGINVKQHSDHVPAQQQQQQQHVLGGKGFLEFLLSGAASFGTPSPPPPPPQHAKSVEELEADLKLQSRPLVSHQHGPVTSNGVHAGTHNVSMLDRQNALSSDAHQLVDKHFMAPPSMGNNQAGAVPFESIMNLHHQSPLDLSSQQNSASLDIMRLLTESNMPRERVGSIGRDQNNLRKAAFKQDLKNVPTQVLLREKELLNSMHSGPRPIVKSNKSVPPMGPTPSASDTGGDFLHKLLQSGQEQPVHGVDGFHPKAIRGGGFPASGIGLRQPHSSHVNGPQGPLALEQLFGAAAMGNSHQGQQSVRPAQTISGSVGVPRPLTGMHGVRYRDVPPSQTIGEVGEKFRNNGNGGESDALAKWFGDLVLGASGQLGQLRDIPPVPRNVLRAEDLERQQQHMFHLHQAAKMPAAS